LQPGPDLAEESYRLEGGLAGLAVGFRQGCSQVICGPLHQLQVAEQLVTTGQVADDLFNGRLIFQEA
jgi:hypothetical protein